MNAHSTALFPARSKPLAACIAALFGLSTPVAMAANVWPVTSCADDGTPGTLRSVIAAASTMSGDIVDLSGLNCAGGKITLYAGDPGIHIAQNSLTISGPGADYLAIDGSQLDPTTYSAFYHTGSGTLKVQYLTVTKGLVNRQGYALGGCIYSKANVTLVSATVTACKAAGDGARGGGIWAGGNVTLASSNVTGNTASAPNGAAGGGIWANGTVSLNSSTVSGNSVTSAGNVHGGGVRSNGDVSLDGSTISGNSVTSTANLASGGAVSTTGNIASSYSVIQGNSATSGGPTALAGGVYVSGHAGFTSSTISGNSVSSFGVRCVVPAPVQGYYFYYGCGGSGSGGGIYAAADFSTSRSTISNNSVKSQYGSAYGGAIAAKGAALVLPNTLISNNYAGTNYARAFGGGIYASTSLTLQFSTLAGNQVKGGGQRLYDGSGVYFYTIGGGGAAVKGNLLATSSTISNNKVLGVSISSYTYGGGLLLKGFENSIATSTISGNVSSGASFYFAYSGGIYVLSAGVGSNSKFYNTTIAFNSIGGAFFSDKTSATLKSTLLSNNYLGDLAIYGSVTFNGGNLAAPANNLIRVPMLGVNLPTDTLTASCPLLGPLRNNGGATKTHALLSGSPAIDMGNNSQNLTEDQRGLPTDTLPYPYPRVSGPAADIGAYEVQKNDIVFNAGFDGC